MIRRETLTRSSRQNIRQIMTISASKTSRTTIGPTRATPTLTIGSRALLAAITGSKVIMTGKRPRKMMESITTFTKTRAATTAAMEVLAMTGAATLTRLGRNNEGKKAKRRPMATSMATLMAAAMLALLLCASATY